MQFNLHIFMQLCQKALKQFQCLCRLIKDHYWLALLELPNLPIGQAFQFPIVSQQ
jgi:hypothetical protein